MVASYTCASRTMISTKVKHMHFSQRYGAVLEEKKIGDHGDSGGDGGSGCR